MRMAVKFRQVTPFRHADQPSSKPTIQKQNALNFLRYAMTHCSQPRQPRTLTNPDNSLPIDAHGAM